MLSGSPSAAKASYTVTFDSNGGSAVKAQAVKNGAKAPRPADPAKSGYLFKGWCSDKSLTKAYDFNSAVKSNLTLYAKWEAKATYTVTFNANGGTAVKAQSVSSGAKASKPANPTKAGHVFKGWYSDKSLTKAYDFNSAVKSNLTLYAKWEANKYTVTFVSNGGSSVAAQVVSYGKMVSQPANPTFSGYLFKGWYSDKTCTKPYAFETAVEADLTLYAKWEVRPPAYAILYSDGLLSLQLGSDQDPSHGEVLGVWKWDRMSKPWSADCHLVKKVIARDDIPLKETHIYGLFSNLSNCDSIDLKKLDISRTHSLREFFSGCPSLRSIDLSGWDTSKVEDCYYMFTDCSLLESLNLSNWEMSSCGNFCGMFAGCSSLHSLNLSGWDVHNGMRFDSMFDGCSSLRSLNLSGWSTWYARQFQYMFADCSSLKVLDLSGWGLENINELDGMFAGCSSLESVDFSGWNISRPWNFVSVYDMFAGCISLNRVVLDVHCDRFVGELPDGPWFDSEGNEYATIPSGIKETFTKTNPMLQPIQMVDGENGLASQAGEVIVRDCNGLLYVIAPEGAAFEYGLEYPELAGRYVGPGAYLTGYAGEGDSLVVPLEVEGVPVVSANLSWNESDRAGMTRLAFVSFERVEGKVSSLAQLDVSGNGLSSLDIEDLDALVRLNCEGNPIADLVALQAWAAQDGHEAKLPQVQDVTPVEPDDVAAPSDSQEPTSPDVPTKPAEPANPETSSAEPEEPSDPAVPSEPEQPGSSDVSGEPDQPGDDSVGSDMGESDEQEEPADTAGLGEAGQDGDASASEEQAGAVELAEAGEGPLALAA